MPKRARNPILLRKIRFRKKLYLPTGLGRTPVWIFDFFGFFCDSDVRGWKLTPTILEMGIATMVRIPPNPSRVQGYLPTGSGDLF